MTADLQVGPGLKGVLGAQDREDSALSYPSLHRIATSLADLCAALGDPVVWAIGTGGERIVGASTVLSRGSIRTAGWNSNLTGLSVLLVAGVVCTPLPLEHAAEHVRRLGGLEVHGCAVEVSGMDECHHASLSSFHQLEQGAR
jgi:hypothetical protein